MGSNGGAGLSASAAMVPAVGCSVGGDGAGDGLQQRSGGGLRWWRREVG
jgi:hypothetical protein